MSTHEIKRVGDSGIYTKEGMVAGSRAAMLSKKRDQEKEEYEKERNKIRAQNTGLGQIDDKFSSSSEVLEAEFRKRTVGLVTAEDFRAARAKVDNARQEDEIKAKEQQALLEEKKKTDQN